MVGRSVYERCALVSGVLAVVSLMSGCASSPGSELATGSATGLTHIEAAGGRYDLMLSKDRVTVRLPVAGAPSAAWAALPGVYQALGLPGSVLDARARVCGIARHSPAPKRIGGQLLSRFFTCGSGVTGSSADRDQLYLLLLSQVDSTARGTELLTRIDVYAEPRATHGGAVACESNGRLEQLLVDSLEARMIRAGR